MKLYVCWGTMPIPWPRSERPWGPSHHACKIAHDALVAAGHSPEVQRVYGLHGILMTRGRKEVQRLTGQHSVPVLVLDDGEAVTGSETIAEWARAHPAAQQRA